MVITRIGTLVEWTNAGPRLSEVACQVDDKSRNLIEIYRRIVWIGLEYRIDHDPDTGQQRAGHDGDVTGTWIPHLEHIFPRFPRVQRVAHVLRISGNVQPLSRGPVAASPQPQHAYHGLYRFVGQTWAWIEHRYDPTLVDETHKKSWIVAERSRKKKREGEKYLFVLS